jgi:hypothetical protein
VEDLVALWEAYEQRRAERAAQVMKISPPPEPLGFASAIVIILAGVAVGCSGRVDPEFTSYLPLTIQSAVSLILLSASLFVILSKSYTPQDRHWAYATIGTILGFWLHFSK